MSTGFWPTTVAFPVVWFTKPCRDRPGARDDFRRRSLVPLVHTAKAIQPLMEQLRQKGLTLYFLPPYSPELNRIEIFWLKVKYEWMAFKTRDSKTLLADLDDIFAKFGEHYQLTF